MPEDCKVFAEGRPAPFFLLIASEIIFSTCVSVRSLAYLKLKFFPSLVCPSLI